MSYAFTKLLCAGLLSSTLISAVSAEETSPPPTIQTVSCRTLIKITGLDGHLSRGLPPASLVLDRTVEYIDSLPNIDRLAGSSCRLAKLVLAECQLHRKFSALEAIQNLLAKADAGKKLPAIVFCGA